MLKMFVVTGLSTRMSLVLYFIFFITKHTWIIVSNTFLRYNGHNIILISSVQHNDLISVYIFK